MQNKPQKYYTVKMNNGDVYGIPAEIIAKNRADYYAKTDPDTTWQEEFDAMMEWFDTNDFEFADWAKNNMNWSDVAEVAVLLRRDVAAFDFEECWINGEYGYETKSPEEAF